MSISHALYNRLNETIRPLVNVPNSQQVTNWLWIVVGLLLGNSPALSKLATYLPMETDAESRVTLIRRWLKNLKVDTGLSTSRSWPGSWTGGGLSRCS